MRAALLATALVGALAVCAALPDAGAQAQALRGMSRPTPLPTTPDAAPGPAPGQAAPAPEAGGPAEDARPVTYTDAQAQRGETAYMRNCSDCHGPNLNDGEFGGPPLKGSHFEQRWGGGTADALYLYTSTLMPPDRPGRLNANTYADIVAFILRANGYPAGGQELPADPDALAEMTLAR